MANSSVNNAIAFQGLKSPPSSMKLRPA